MWILDTAGDFLDGKRVWLRPGKKYLFGRIRQDGVRHAIQHSSISRKHMVIEVSPVQPGDGSHIYTKSEIIVHDQGSKCGTMVDGEQIRDASKKLTNEEHTIKLGKYQHTLRIKWQPVVLSFSFPSKELKAKDPLAQVRSRLEDLDIKTIIPYVVNKTTHVVQSKRNTAKGLQALVNGKYIVQDSYIDALVYAATPSDLENLESLSPLEADFDSAWPDPAEHLPPPGKEAVQRPKEAFAPNPDRISVFEGYTFVFGDASQFETLLDPISNGHGKALLYQIENGATTAEEIVQFMRNAAGHKGLGGDREGSGGVVLVRFRAKGRYEDWSIELSNQVAIMTDQRVIEQKEFLDAILENDASCLCRPLPEKEASSQEIEATQTLGPTSIPNENVQIIADSQPSEEPSQPSKTTVKPRVRSFVSKMKTFDDGFDISSIPAYVPEDEGDEPVDSQLAMDIEPLSEQQSQKRSSHEDEEDDLVSSLLPGARAMEKRRAETVKHNLDDPVSHPKQEVHKPKRQKLDVLEAARQHREAEEDADRQRRQQEASLHDSLGDMDVEKLKNLALVEEMEIKPRADPAGDNSRWDERWNGRKNFKKFRRNRDPDQPRHRIQAVIVPLEEVTRKEFGIGGQYWVSSRPSADNRPSEDQREHSVSQEVTSRPRSQSLSQSQSRVTESEIPAPRSQKRVREERDSDSDDELRFRFRRRR